MKKAIYFLALTISVGVSAQDSDYSVSSYLDEGFKAPNTRYIGEAWLKNIINNIDVGVKNHVFFKKK